MKPKKPKKERFILVERVTPLMFEDPIKKRVSSLEKAEEIARKDYPFFGYFGYEVYIQKRVNRDGKACYTRPRRLKSVIFGKVYTLEQIAQMGENGLVSRLENEKLSSAIRTCIGTWEFPEKGLQVVDWQQE